MIVQDRNIIGTIETKELGEMLISALNLRWSSDHVFTWDDDWQCIRWTWNRSDVHPKQKETMEDCIELFCRGYVTCYEDMTQKRIFP